MHGSLLEVGCMETIVQLQTLMHEQILLELVAMETTVLGHKLKDGYPS